VFKSARAGMLMDATANSSPTLSTLYRLGETELAQAKIILAELQRYLLVKGQFVTDRYRSRLEKNNERLLHARIGEFEVTDMGAAELSGHRWDVTITVQNALPVRTLFDTGLDVSLSLDDFRLCSSEPPAIDVRVTHPVHGAGTVTHVELEYKLQHSCTLYIDAATNKATRPSVCTCGYFRRTLLPCDGLSYTYAHRKISESDDSLVNKQHDLRCHPDAQQACHGKGSVPPGMPSVAVTTNQQVACGMFLIPAEALAREERAMQTAIGGGCAKTRRFHRMSDAVKGLIPIAKNSDRNAALFILSLQALEEVYSSKCEQHGEILVGDHRVPLYGGSGVQRRERAKPVAKRLQGAAPTEGTVGVKRARLPGLCQRCAKLGVERGMVDADDPVLNHNKIDRCILKAPYDPAKVDCTWSQLVSYATTLPPGWVHTTLVDANFPSGRTIKFRVPRVRYPTAAAGDVFRVLGLNWVFSEETLERSGMFAVYALPTLLAAAS